MVHDVIRAALLYHHTVFHDHDVVRHGSDHSKIVTDEEIGQIVGGLQPAQQLDDQLAVLGRRPAGTEGDVGVGEALDVRHPPAIACDGDALAGPLDLDRLLGAEPERLALEVPPEIGVGAIRFSLGRTTTEEEIEAVVKNLKAVLA